VRRASRFRGPKLFTAFATCPTGWGYDPRQGYHIAKLALDTGVWTLKEAIEGEVRHTSIPDRRRPAKEHLSTQCRFQHLFVPRRQDDGIRRIQDGIDAYWDKVGPRLVQRLNPGR
jgi:pyruvate ferredoxin oxidoreductase beta subunit